jgi:glycosyltransferase involved in cell wall biosynthesis
VERRCHRRALFTIAQDRTRAELHARDNGVPPESFAIVPNAPLGSWQGGRSTLLHRRLGLPEGTPIVLHAGGVTPQTMVLELIESIADWPPGPVLVVHGAPQTTYLPLLRAAAERFPGRVLLSTLFTPPGEVDEIFASAAVGVAFYRPIDDNFRFVGHAAGKIFNLLKVGVPVVTNDLPGMRALIEESGCGRVVDEPARLGEALRMILATPGAWRARCLENFARYEFSRHYAGVIARVEASLRPE